MAEPIRLNDAYKDGFGLYATSGYLLGAITDFRNGPCDEYGDRKEMGCLETLARRVVGELAYAALIVVALVEIAVKSIIFIPGLVLIGLMPDSKIVKHIAFFGFGFAFALPTLLASLVALVQNVYTKEMDANKIIPCFTPDSVMDGTFCCIATACCPLWAPLAGGAYIADKCDYKA